MTGIAGLQISGSFRMRKQVVFLGILVVLIAVFLPAAFFAGEEGASVTFLTDSGAVKVVVEVADTQEAREVGLMNREHLEGGMLFVFDSEGKHGFWMKNTLIPLDMIFISGDGKVVSIREAVPCEADPCQLYHPDKPAKYVVEVNAGFSGENGINVGDSIEIYGLTS